MSFKTRLEIFILDTLPRWLMYAAGVMLLFIIGLQAGIWKGRTMQIEDFRMQIAESKRELSEAEDTIKILEEKLKKQELIRRIIQCESSGRHEGIWGDGGKSYGLFQFQEKTFYWLAGKMKQKSQRVRESKSQRVKESESQRGHQLNWKNRGHQYIVASWAIENGYGDLWTCYRKSIKSPSNPPLIKGEAGDYKREG